MDLDRVIVGGGSRDRKLLVPPTALTALDGAEVVADLAKPLDPHLTRLTASPLRVVARLDVAQVEQFARLTSCERS